MKAKSAVGLELALQLVLVTAWPSRSGGRQWCTSLLCHQGAWELSQDMALLSLLILCGSFIPSSILRFLTGTCSTKKKKRKKKVCLHKEFSVWQYFCPFYLQFQLFFFLSSPLVWSGCAACTRKLHFLWMLTLDPKPARYPLLLMAREVFG